MQDYSLPRKLSSHAQQAPKGHARTLCILSRAHAAGCVSAFVHALGTASCMSWWAISTVLLQRAQSVTGHGGVLLWGSVGAGIYHLSLCSMGGHKTPQQATTAWLQAVFAPAPQEPSMHGMAWPGIITMSQHCGSIKSMRLCGFLA